MNRWILGVVLAEHAAFFVWLGWGWFRRKRVLPVAVVPALPLVPPPLVVPDSRGPSFSAATHPEPAAAVHAPEGFPGAVAPNRYLIIFWPTGRVAYAGCLAGLARQTYENSHPAKGEAVEMWDQGTCRAHKGR
jgi:hypothetical protein